MRGEKSRLITLLGLVFAGIMSSKAEAVTLPPLPQSAPLQAQAAQTPVTSNASVKDDRIRVQFSSRQQTSLSAEVSAKLISLPLKEGERFKAGQLLAAFDCAINRAQMNKAEASAEAARQTLKVSRRLAELESISTLEVDQASAKLKETEAEATMMRVMQGKCSINAPFSGRVAKVYVETHQYVPQGKPLFDIVDTQRPEVKLLIPSKWLAWIAKGTRFKIHVDDLNIDVDAKVTRLGARIDPVNQTVSLFGEVATPVETLLPGMSGWAVFTQPKAK